MPTPVLLTRPTFVLARVFGTLLSVAAVSLLQACSIGHSSRIPAPSPAESAFASVALSAVVAKYVEHEQLERFELRARVGGPLVTIPNFDYETARDDARFARAAVRRIDGIDVEALSESDYLTLLTLRRSLQAISERALYFENDLTLFTPGSPLADVMRMMTELPLRDSTETGRYLSLLLSLEPVADSLRSDLAGRAARGIVLSRPAIARATEFFSAFTLPAERHVLHVGSSRLTLLDAASARRFVAAVDSMIDKHIAPGYQRLTRFLTGPYAVKAPANIGLWQYVGGKEYYATLVRHWTTLDITPEQVHDAGRREVARLDSALRAMRRRMGGPVIADSFHMVLRQDARNQARDSDAAVDRIFLAQAQWPVSTDTAHEPVKVWPVIVSGPGEIPPADRIFGSYRPPSGVDSLGRYILGSAIMSPGMLAVVDALSFFALIPGRHELLGRQLAPSLKVARYYSNQPAFTDGWAFMAVDIARTRSALTDLQSQYGALMLEMIACVRTVVDSGIHYFGWTEAQARAFIGQYTLLAGADVANEVARMAFDAPGAGLAACLGARELRGMRVWMQRELRKDFDEQRFTDELSSLGPIPLQALGLHFEYWLYTEHLRLRELTNRTRPRAATR